MYNTGKKVFLLSCCKIARATVLQGVNPELSVKSNVNEKNGLDQLL